jgi:hypothetical protein
MCRGDNGSSGRPGERRDVVGGEEERLVVAHVLIIVAGGFESRSGSLTPLIAHAEALLDLARGMLDES